MRRWMRGRAWILAGAVTASGCWSYSDLIPEPEPEPGGEVQAAMDEGALRGTAALADARSEPLKIEGASGELTFSLTVGDDPLGASGADALATPGRSVTLPLTPTSRTRLQIHQAGTGCVGREGTIQLSTDEAMALSGTFQATGQVFGGTGPCTISGTLSGVPQVR